MSDYRVEIRQDEDAESPRTMWDTLGTMVCFHKRYNLGDSHDLKTGDFTNWNAVRRHLVNRLDAVPEVILPLYLYDHSGITMSTTPFSCQWDSGQVGFIYTTLAAIRSGYAWKRMSANRYDIVRQALIAEVELYDQYLTGDVWGYAITDETGDCVDSCYGFYGREYAEAESEAALKAMIETATVAHEQRGER